MSISDIAIIYKYTMRFQDKLSFLNLEEIIIENNVIAQ